MRQDIQNVMRHVNANVDQMQMFVMITKSGRMTNGGANAKN